MEDGTMIAILVRVFSVNHRKHVATLLLTAIACMLIGAALFAGTQHIPFSKGVYWAITTATTVGYGDVTPHNGVGEIIASGVMLTTIPLLAAVFALLTGVAAANGIRRILQMRHQFPTGAYRIVIGSDSTVPAILHELLEAGEDIVLVADVEPSAVPGRVHLVRGDPTRPEAIEAARPQDARQALITGATDGDVLVSAVLLRKAAPDLSVVALVRSPSVREALRELGITRAISAGEMIAHTLAKSLEAPHAADMLSQLVESNQHSLTEVEADPGTVGRPLSSIRDERSGLVLGLVHDGAFSLGIGEDPVVATGDYLLLAEPLRR
jgi:voltage-gated potassium channel